MNDLPFISTLLALVREICQQSNKTTVLTGLS